MEDRDGFWENPNHPGWGAIIAMVSVIGIIMVGCVGVVLTGGLR